MCGIIGTIGNQDIALEIYEGLIALQHRGQESAGIATYNQQFHLRKGMGLVREVFKQRDIEALKGNMGIGLVRYSTIGSSTLEEVQPFIVNSPYGITMVHNGNLYNSWKLKEELFEQDLRFINSGNDAEVLLNLFAHGLAQSTANDFFEKICDAVRHVYTRARGGYSVVAIIAGKGLVAFRDPHGIRPLVWGTRTATLRDEHMFSSENVMFQTLGYQSFRDVEHGQVVFVGMKGDVHTRVVLQKEFRPCIFEYVYFARADALLNGVSVYRSRLRMGQNLAAKIKRVHPNLPIDIVIPAPSTAVTAALSCAHVLGLRFSQGIHKNHFIGRTFIMPGNTQRQKANQFKLSVIDFEVREKNVLVIDDSIVRGNVSRHIVNLMRQHGAKQVYFASASPPLRWPDLYGIDLPTREEYMAHNKSEEEIRRDIGADVLIYQDLPDLIEAVTRKGDLKFIRPHAAYFNGEYPTEDVNEELLKEIEERRRAERAKITTSL
jgi:amidophosphoribosyltransferase